MPIKRLFFAFEMHAPWEDIPKGRTIASSMRHLSVAFLGNILFEKLESHLANVPSLPFRVGLTGFFDRLLFLPPHHANVAAWHAAIPKVHQCETYAVEIHAWLQKIGIDSDLRLPWLPHVTIARAPFSRNEWEKAFVPLPCAFHTLHLYESFPNLVYKPIWSMSLAPPFEEISHTADLAFLIRGESIEAIYNNAFTALAFYFPALLRYSQKPPRYEDEVVARLNQALAYADAEIGCPFKAVSHHGEIEKNQAGIFNWEMIVDV